MSCLDIMNSGARLTASTAISVPRADRTRRRSAFPDRRARRPGRGRPTARHLQLHIVLVGPEPRHLYGGRLARRSRPPRCGPAPARCARIRAAGAGRTGREAGWCSRRWPRSQASSVRHGHRRRCRPPPPARLPRKLDIGHCASADDAMSACTGASSQTTCSSPRRPRTRAPPRRSAETPSSWCSRS